MLKRLLLILASMLAAAGMWIWVQEITIAHQETEASQHGLPRGNLSDLYPRWLGTRELLLRGRDPYRDDITREIQTGYYGRPIDPARPNDPKDEQAFAYPLFVVFVLAPTIAFPFSIVQRAFLWLLVLLTAISVLWWMDALRWRISATWKLIWMVLIVGCFPAIQGFKLQQLTLLVAAFLAASMGAIAHRRFVLAGFLLALASIKPQLVLVLGMWLIIWISGNWRQRQALLWSAAASIGALLVVSELLLPGWIREFRAATSAYYRYTGGGTSLLDLALTPIGGRLVSASLVGVLMMFLWQVRREPEGSAAFQWSLAAVLATTLVIIPMFAPYNQVLLLPCLMLMVKTVHRLWQRGKLSRFLVVVVASSIFWPWLAALVLASALLVLPASTVEKAWPLPLGTTLMIPVSLVALMFFSRRAICDSGTP